MTVTKTTPPTRTRTRAAATAAPKVQPPADGARLNADGYVVFTVNGVDRTATITLDNLFGKVGFHRRLVRAMQTDTELAGADFAFFILESLFSEEDMAVLDTLDSDSELWNELTAIVQAPLGE